LGLQGEKTFDRELPVRALDDGGVDSKLYDVVVASAAMCHQSQLIVLICTSSHQNSRPCHDDLSRVLPCVLRFNYETSCTTCLIFHRTWLVKSNASQYRSDSSFSAGRCLLARALVERAVVKLPIRLD
jgi:hypothetical protein